MITKQSMLFVDDKEERREMARKSYSSEYDISFASNFFECMRSLVEKDFNVVSLDHDLNGSDFEDMDSPMCGMAIVRYVTAAWPSIRKQPSFCIHSTNIFAATAMDEALRAAGFSSFLKPFGWKKYQHGVVAGAFDLIHPGYISLLKEAKELCHKVTVLIHNKPNQVLSIQERTDTLLALKYVDDVIPYSTEDELIEILLAISPNVRIVGDDHMNSTSRPDLPFPTHYHARGDWSATLFRKKISENWQEKRYKVKP